MKLFFIIVPVPVLATISSQTPAFSTIAFSRPTLIKVPAGVYVTGFTAASHPYYVVVKAKIHKTIQKYCDCAYDIERGILIELGDNQYIRDVSVHGDFSARYLGIASAGIVLSVLFRLFG